MDVKPPKRALQFLRWFCREDYLDEVEGDLMEIFRKQYGASPRKANLAFTGSVLRYFRPEFIKRFRLNPNNTAVIYHNLLITYRNLWRHKMSSFINLVGLSAGLACTMLIYLWVESELQVDSFHANDKRLYRVMENRLTADGIWTARSAPGLMGETLQAEMPEVEYAINTSQIESYTLSVDEKDIKARGQFVGKDFFRMFTYGLTQGDAASVLSDKNSVVISDELAYTLFGTAEDAVGKLIEFEHETVFKVSGVFERVPSSSSEQFDFVGSFEKYKEGRDYLQYWGNTASYAFVLLREDAEVNVVNTKLAPYIAQKTDNHVTHRTPFLKHFSRDYLYGQYENGTESGGRITYVRLFSIIAVFILVIACINFMNLSTAKASRRTKEVGIKKVIGARRRSLAIQYLTESMLMSVSSTILAIVLVVILLPQFSQVTGKQLTPHLSPSLAAFLVVISTITGFLAGSYPAFHLSGFKPVAILKGSLVTSSTERWTRKGLVVFQFVLSVVFIVSVFVVYKQTQFVQSKHLGFNKDHVIYFPLVGELKKTVNQESLIAEMKSVPGIVGASSTNHDLTGHSRGTYAVYWEGKDPNDRTEFELMIVNFDFLETLGFEMATGRSFSRSYNTESTKVIFNEAAIEFMAMQEPLGKTVRLGNDQNLEIIGVVKDFHFQSLHENIKPALILVEPNSTHLLMVKITAGTETQTIPAIESLYKKLNPGFPFDYQFLDEEYSAQYAAEQRVSLLSKYFAGIAILISALGLFGLAAFTAERRTKEIGIRKALGSSDVAIVGLLSGEYTRMVLTAIIIALPLSYLLAQNWLSSFAFRIDLEWWFFAGAGIIALVVSWLTVGTLTIKAARSNPTVCLRTE